MNKQTKERIESDLFHEIISMNKYNRYTVDLVMLLKMKRFYYTTTNDNGGKIMNELINE